MGWAWPGVGPGNPEPPPGRSHASGSDDLVGADVAAGAAGAVDPRQGVLGGLDALTGLSDQRLVVLVVGGQGAALCLRDEIVHGLSQGNHSSVARTSGYAEVKPTMGYAGTILRQVSRLCQYRLVQTVHRRRAVQEVLSRLSVVVGV